MNNEIQRAEKQIKDFKEQVALKEATERMMSSMDFKNIILRYFCVEECARYAHTSADPNMSKEAREDALNMAQSAGHLKRFLTILVQVGEQAEQGILDTEEELSRLLAQQADPDQQPE